MEEATYFTLQQNAKQLALTPHLFIHRNHFFKQAYMPVAWFGWSFDYIYITEQRKKLHKFFKSEKTQFIKK